MIKGQVIKDYIVTRDFELSGLSKWSFAKRGSKEFFIKEFLSPVFPTSDAPGGKAVKAKKMKACEHFEKQQISLIEKVSSSVSEGGNLIFTKDFFRFGAKYYKVTEKVDVASIGIKDIFKLPIEKKLLILKTVAHSYQFYIN